MKRRQPPPDTRPDWRDPDMPVLMHRKSTGKLDAVAPAIATKVAKYRVENDPVPSWRNDPTYHMRKPKP